MITICQKYKKLHKTTIFTANQPLMNKIILLFLIGIFCACESRDQMPKQAAQETEVIEVQEPASLPEVWNRLYKDYETYREASITNRRFKHSDIVPLIEVLPPPFQLIQAGESVEGRSIYHISWGKGATQVLMWSQMHGDEPTATMALFDIFNFLLADDTYNEFRERLSQTLTIHFLPLLNPDGAEVYKRRNALGIDLNRDALRLQSPESQFLKKIRDEIQADWGFNLHDQSRYYAAGDRNKTASVSFLAPAYNYAKDVNENREDVMQLIVLLNQLLQDYIPGNIARYDDAFEPRAFGDNMQKWGTRTILVESGGLVDDLEKQELRRLHFVLLLAGLDAIAGKQYDKVPSDDYHQIPMNNGAAFFDLILREVTIEKDNKEYLVDLGFRQTELNTSVKKVGFYPRARLAEIGDLSTLFAYEELKGQGFKAVPGRLYEKAFDSLQELKRQNIPALLRQGYTSFRVNAEISNAIKAYLPIEVVQGHRYYNEIQLYGNPSFLLEKDGRYHYALINGRLYDLEKDMKEIQASM